MIRENTIRKYTSERIYYKAENLYYDGHVGPLEISAEGPYLRVAAYVRSAHSSKMYHTVVYLKDKANSIQYYECSCPFAEDFNGLCKHACALLLKFAGTVRFVPDELVHLYSSSVMLTLPESLLYGEERQTDMPLLNMIEIYSNRNEKTSSVVFEPANVQLQPSITLCGSFLEASFMIGTPGTHMYVVRNIYELMERIENELQFSYGKKLTFTHRISSFDPAFQPLAQFLKDWKEMSDSIPESDVNYYYSSKYYPRSSLKLSGAMADRFIETIKNIPFSIFQKTCRKIIDGIPALNVQLKKDKSGYFLVNRSFRYTAGQNYLYYWLLEEPETLYRQPKQQTQNLIPILETMSTYDKPLFLSDKNINDFAKNVYPKIADAMTITSPDLSLDMYIPAKPAFSVYLDLPQNDLITAKLTAKYGDMEFNILEPAADTTTRSIDEESRFNQRVTRWFNSFDNENHLLVLINDDEKLYHLLKEGIPQMQEEAQVFISDRLKRLTVTTKPKVHIGISIQSDLLSLDVDSDELTNDQLAEIMSRYSPKKRYYKLKNGSVIEIGDDIDQLSQLQSDLQISNKDLRENDIEVPAFRALYLDQSRNASDTILKSFDEQFEDLVYNMKVRRNYKIPDTLKDTLRDYQKKGFNWLSALKENHFSGLLADEMGLGKSLQVIAVLKAWENRGQTLIVCPASLVYNWSNEFRKFAPDIPVCIITGTAGVRKHHIKESAPDAVLITSYDLLKRDISVYQELTFDCEIIDEAQYIKNSTTLASKAVKAIRSSFRIALTGTPIENRISELWSIFDYLMPGLLFAYSRFKTELEEPIVIGQDEEARKRLQSLTGPFILRRKKSQVLKDLPPKIEEVLYAPLEDEQKELYQARVQRMKTSLSRQSDDEYKHNKIEVLAELTHLREICCNPALIYDHYSGNSAKEDLCIETIRSAIDSGHKILLFSQFTSMLDLLMKRLDHEGIRYYLINGSVPSAKRMELVNAFQSDDTPVFCISLHAGGTGLNLTAADIVIHYDPWWNTAVENQASDRAHRIGQTNSVTVYRIILQDTIEEKIIELQQKKADLANDILSSEQASSSSLSKEDLLKLL